MYFKSKTTFGLVVVLAITCWARVQAAVVTTSVTQDNTLFESALGTLSNGAGIGLFVGRNNQPVGTSIRRGLVQFDLSHIPIGSTINSATLRLTQTQVTGQAVQTSISVHRVNSSWGEGTSDSGQSGAGAAATPGSATWLHRFSPTTTWNSAGGDFVATSSATNNAITVNGTYDWNSSRLATDVQHWVDNPNANFGWLLLGNEQVAQNARRFASREVLASAPQLIVDFTAVPEPTGNLVLLLAIGAISSRNRKATRRASQRLHL